MNDGRVVEQFGKGGESILAAGGKLGARAPAGTVIAEFELLQVSTSIISAMEANLV